MTLLVSYLAKTTEIERRRLDVIEIIPWQLPKMTEKIRKHVRITAVPKKFEPSTPRIKV
jgi:glycerol-3-phosphate responsive antiterminator